MHWLNLREEHLKDGAAEELRSLWKALVMKMFKLAQPLERATAACVEVISRAAISGVLIGYDND
jgi:hypothetical protein